MVVVGNLPIVCEGIRDVLAANPSYEVVGETDLGLVAMQLVETLHPDVALVDLILTDLNGLEVTRRMVRASPQTRDAIYSVYSAEPRVHDALRAGPWPTLSRASGPM